MPPLTIVVFLSAAFKWCIIVMQSGLFQAAALMCGRYRKRRSPYIASCSAGGAAVRETVRPHTLAAWRQGWRHDTVRQQQEPPGVGPHLLPPTPGLVSGGTPALHPTGGQGTQTPNLRPVTASAALLRLLCGRQTKRLWIGRGWRWASPGRVQLPNAARDPRGRVPRSVRLLPPA